MHPSVHCSTIYNSLDMEKNHKCPSIEERIKKLQYIYTMEYYSAIKMNEIESVVARWMNLESVTQNEVRKRKTNTIYYVWTLEKWY